MKDSSKYVTTASLLGLLITIVGFFCFNLVDTVYANEDDINYVKSEIGKVKINVDNIEDDTRETREDMKEIKNLLYNIYGKNK
jgi:hypothetical protein